MTTYVDTSALLKRYVAEPDSPIASELISADPQLVTGRHTVVEVRQNLAALLDPADATAARSDFATDLGSFHLVEIDAQTIELAATIAEQTGLRSLDALHLGSAMRLGTAMAFLTFDVRLAVVARQLGFRVLGV